MDAPIETARRVPGSEGPARDALLWGICWIILAVTVAIAVITPFVTGRAGSLLAIHAFVVSSMGVALALLHRGHSRAAGNLSVWVVWLVVTSACWFLGGPRSPAFFAYPGVVVVALFAWRRRSAFGLAVLSTLTGLAIVGADARGWVPESLVPLTSGRQFAAMAALTLLMTAVVDLALRTARSGLAEAARRVKQQEAVAELGRLALEARDPQELFEETVRAVAETVDAELVKILELDPVEGVLILRAGVGWAPGLLGRARVTAGCESQAGYTLEQASPVVVEDFSQEKRFPAPPLLRDHDVASGVSCVIAGSEAPWGVLGVHSRVPRRFRQADVHFVHAVANVLSAAIRRSRLEDRLRQSEKLEVVGQLAGRVAHDFNNLLTVIAGYAESLIKQAEPGEQADSLAEIAAAADRAGLLTRQLLTLSRCEVVQRRPLDLGEAVRRILGMLRVLCGTHVELRLELSEPLEPVTADAAEIEQLLLNLAVNARDAMPDGGVLTIQTRSLVPAELPERASPGPDRPWVRLSVSDTGLGMDRQTSDRVFEPFFSTKEAGRGTGLGLASVQRTVQQLGGRVRLTSEPGAGARFDVDLPASSGSVTAREAPRLARPAADRATTILLAEDEESVRSLVRRALESEGYAVLEAEDGESAIAVAEQHALRVDVLVTDLVMPRLGGLDLSERLRERLPDLPVVLTSGYEDRLPSSLEVTDPLTRLLRKPYLTSDLARVLREIFDA